MPFFVYILFPATTSKYYVGQTDDVELRLEKHNSFIFTNSSTKNGIPWGIFHVIVCDTRRQAVNIETHIKKMKSVKYYHSLKLYPDITERLKLKCSF